MIVRKYRGQFLVIRQTDHGIQCAAFARHWGGAACDAPQPFEPLLYAAAEHDNGWAEWETYPTLDPETGQPLQFVGVPAKQHTPLYWRGIQRSAAHDPYGGLLVSMHGLGLYNDRYGTYPRPVPRPLDADEQALVATYFRDNEALQARLRQQIAADPRYAGLADEQSIFRAYKLLQVWDRLSLQFCWHGCKSGEIAPLPLRNGAPDGTLVCEGDGDLTLRLSPYPFDESPVTLAVPARLLPDRRFASTEDFLATYAAAEPLELPFRAVA